MDVSQALFDPHQLDFDWRFSSTAAYAISDKIASNSKLLLIGCPSLIPAVQHRISSGLIIERNPYHANSEKFESLVTDVRFYDPRAKYRQFFDAAVFDAPWYPAEFVRWLDLALAYTRVGGKVLFVLWPEDTRPSAPMEHRRILRLLQSAGELDCLGTISYEIPPFEEASIRKATHEQNFSREGILFSLTKLSNLPFRIPSFPKSSAIWKRYRLGSHQIALKFNSCERWNTTSINFSELPHVLSDTSRRNKEAKSANAWASNNVVARIENPYFIDVQLTKLSSGVISKPAMSFLERMGLLEGSVDFEWGKTWIHRV